MDLFMATSAASLLMVVFLGGRRRCVVLVSGEGCGVGEEDEGGGEKWRETIN